MIIACSDSRVDPQSIFGAGPGELFVVRNVANLVPPFEKDSAYHGTSAAVEFAVRELKVRDLIVLGHGMCGGVHTLLHGLDVAAAEFIGVVGPEGRCRAADDRGRGELRHGDSVAQLIAKR